MARKYVFKTLIKVMGEHKGTSDLFYLTGGQLGLIENYIIELLKYDYFGKIHIYSRVFDDVLSEMCRRLSLEYDYLEGEFRIRSRIVD